MTIDDTQFPTIIASRIIKVVARWFKDVQSGTSEFSPHSGACSYVITLKNPSVHMEPNGCERKIKKLQFCLLEIANVLEIVRYYNCVSIQC